MKATIQNLMINVTVNLATGSTAQLGFGIPLYVGRNATFSEYSLPFTSADEVLVDTGLTSADPEYKAAVAAFANGADTIRIGRIAERRAQVTRGTITTAHSGAWVWEIVDETGTYSDTVTATTETAAQIAEAIKTSINAVTDIPVTASYTATNTYFACTANIAGRDFTLTITAPSGGARTITTTVANLSVGDEMTALQDENDSWFAVQMVGLADAGHDEDTRQLASWLSTQTLKIQLAQSSDADIYDANVTTDIASVIKSLDYNNTKVLFHASQTEQTAAGAIANLLAIDQDTQTTGLNLTPSIGSAGDELTVSQCQAAGAKGACVFVASANGSSGDPRVREFPSSGYKFLDDVISAAWFNARLSEAFLALSTKVRDRQSRIPQDDSGYTMLKAVVQQVYDQGVLAGKFLADSLVFTLDPTRAEVASTYPTWLENREYRMQFNVALAGQVGTISATANLSY